MNPKIAGTRFGSITVGGTEVDHDVVIRLSGEVVKRKKKLSRAVYGTSHTVSLPEAKFICEKGAERLIVGSGQSGMLTLSEEAGDYFRKKGCEVEILPTPRAAVRWNEASGSTIGLFHLTC